MFNVLHPTFSSDLFISNLVLPSYLTYLNILQSKLATVAVLPVFLLLPQFPQHTVMQASHMHGKHNAYSNDNKIYSTS